MGPERGKQHQQGQYSHPLGDDAKPRGKPAEPVPAPPSLAEQEAQKTIETEGDEGRRQGIDLRRLGLQGELDGEQQQ